MMTNLIFRNLIFLYSLNQMVLGVDSWEWYIIPLNTKKKLGNFLELEKLPDSEDIFRI